MTDFLAGFEWMVLCWMIMQVETGVEDESVQEIEAEPYEPIELIIKITIGLVSCYLVFLSLHTRKHIRGQ